MGAVVGVLRLSLTAALVAAAVSLGIHAAVQQTSPPPEPPTPVYPVAPAPPLPSVGSSSDTSQTTVPPLPAQTVPPAAGTPCMMPRPASTAVCLYGVWMEP